MMRLWHINLTLLACAAMTGCAASSRTVVEFKEPRFYLHLYESPESVMSSLRTDGPSFQTKDQLGHANADLVVAGTGDVYLGGRVIKVEADRISIDGTPIASLVRGYRNVTIDTDGKIRSDHFIPFEPVWGYHPSPQE